MNKKFEYVDDNPGSYFGMLVENWGDYSENDVNVVIKKVEDTYVDENGIVSKDNYNKVSKYLDKNYPEIKDVVIDNLIDMYGKPSDESLKEDKFIPQDKMSKKVQKELNDKKRGTWGSTNPVTRVQPNKKAYDRKRDKKVVDEDIENKDSEEYLGVDEVKRFVNAREKLLDISDSMTTDLRLGRISREDVLYYRNEIKEIYSFLNSLYFGR